MRRAVLIVNPFATRVTEEAVRLVEEELDRVASVETLLTQRPRHATELAESACRGGCDAIVVFSGDGGFNEALNGADGDIALGFLPGGGTSVLPRALGFPRESVAAARLLADAVAAGRTRRIGLGRVNGRRFAFSAGVGLDAETVRRVDELGRAADGRRPGDTAFVRELLTAVLGRRVRFEPVLEIEGYGEAAMAFVANANPYTYAGRVPVPVVPGADFDAGLALLAPRRVTAATLPLFVPAILGSRAIPAGAIHAVDLDRIVVTCERSLPLQADGEDLGDVQRAEFVAERGAVAVLAPA